MNAEYIYPTRNFIKDETPAQVFCCGFCEFLQPVTLLKTRLQRRCFLANFANIFSACNFNKNETTAQVFYCEF